MTDDCPFCTHVLTGDRPWLADNGQAVAFHDAYPSADGHVLIIPRRHVGRLADLTADEYRDLFALARDLLVRFDDAGVDGCTVGVNDGPAAGQTVPHVHLHLIPRWPGDVADPRGGIRWVLPDTAAYWD